MEHDGLMKAIWSTVSRIKDTVGPLPIGRPIARTRVGLRRDTAVRRPVPVGAFGEAF